MSKILIIGRGQIGRALAESLNEYEVHVWSRDIDDLKSEELTAIAPAAIINAAGKTDLAWCEANAREAVRCNLEAPVRLYDRILDRVAGSVPAARTPRFIHFSSACVWDGPYRTDGKPFEPNDPPTPACLYSWTKAACDAMLLDRDPTNVAIIRARQVFSSAKDPRNTLVKLQKYAGLIDTPNSMSSMSVIIKMVRHTLHADDWQGTWNVYDRGVVTPYEVGVMLAEAGVREMPQKISKNELNAFHQPKRVDTVLYDARFEAAIEPSQTHDELRRAIHAMNHANTD